MASETVLREKLATCTRIFAMQGMIGLFGHLSAYLPGEKRVLMNPGMAKDKATIKPEDQLLTDLSGKVIDGEGHVPVEWPIHTALHTARSDALAIAHLHPPYATLFSIARTEFRPVTLQGSKFAGGVPLYTEADLVRTPVQGERLVKAIGEKPAVLMRGHGIVVVGRDIEEILFASLVLEDDARKTMQAATLGEVGFIGAEESRAFNAEVSFERRARRAWNYFCQVEARWDRQPATGGGPLA